jgi:hypothetical protein
MQPSELSYRDRLKGTLFVLAWVTLAMLLRDWHRIGEYVSPVREPAPHASHGAQPEPPDGHGH